jgi:hypothetical protein
MNEGDEVQELLTQFLATWTAGSVEPRNGVPEIDLLKFEQRNGVRLPVGFRMYLRRANGMREGEMDNERLVRFYGIDEITALPSANTDPDVPRYFTFADFMIGSHEYAIGLSGANYDEVVIIEDNGAPRHVADSFSEFMAKYVRSPETIWRGETT